MNRVSFLVDGFNLYHSLRDASRDLGGSGTRWLDLRALLSSYMSVFGSGAALHEIHYFSALATHLDARRPGTTTKHRLYLECLRATSVIIELGRFKLKDVHCRQCGQCTPHYEEKETDVAISVRLLELLNRGDVETVVLVTGDTDLAPAVRTGQRLYPTKEIAFAFPYRRKNNELARLTPRHFQVHKKQYLRFQFADPFVHPAGFQIPKPASW